MSLFTLIVGHFAEHFISYKKSSLAASRLCMKTCSLHLTGPLKYCLLLLANVYSSILLFSLAFSLLATKLPMSATYANLVWSFKRVHSLFFCFVLFFFFQLSKLPTKRFFLNHSETARFTSFEDWVPFGNCMSAFYSRVLHKGGCREFKLYLVRTAVKILQWELLE